MTKLFEKCNKLNLQFHKVAEVGVYKPETSNILDYIKLGTTAILVEPDPASIQEIETVFAGYQNITLHKVAVFDYCGEVELSQCKASTFISSLPDSPAITNDKYKITEGEKFIAPCVTFDQIDPGDIDLLSIDIEGAEWYVLKNLTSLPNVISIETHGKFYKNPFLKEITNFLNEKQYVLWYKDKSDSVFILNHVYKPDFKDKFRVKLQELKLRIKALKRSFK